MPMGRNWRHSNRSSPVVRPGAVAEIPPNAGAFPLVRAANDPLVPKPGNAAVTVLLTDGVKENPLKPLKVALLSVWKRSEDVERGKKAQQTRPKTSLPPPPCFCVWPS